MLFTVFPPLNWLPVLNQILYWLVFSYDPFYVSADWLIFLSSYAPLLYICKFGFPVLYAAHSICLWWKFTPLSSNLSRYLWIPVFPLLKCQYSFPAFWHLKTWDPSSFYPNYRWKSRTLWIQRQSLQTKFNLLPHASMETNY